MKKISLALLAIFAVLTFSSCRKVVGDGPVITEQRSTGDFTGIEMGVPADMYYTPGSAFKVELSAQRNILDVIETYVSDNKLKVKVKNSVNIRSHENITIKITAPDVTWLGVNGSGKINVTETFQPVETTLSVNGSGDIMVPRLVAGQVTSKISGSGKIEVFGGSADNVSMSISGSGLIDMIGLTANSGNTNTSGSGTIRLHVLTNLDCKISGSGDVIYKGNPKVSTSISGSGRVRPL